MHLFGRHLRLHHLRIACAILCGLAVILSTLPVVQGPSHHHHTATHAHNDIVALILDGVGQDQEDISNQGHSHIGTYEHHQAFLLITPSIDHASKDAQRWLDLAHGIPRQDFLDRFERPPRTTKRA
jgi:hypothetical protein